MVSHCHRSSPAPGIKALLHLFLTSTFLTLPTSSSAAAIPDSVDVAIVGAGLSGLTAAKNLLAGGKTVLVLEARNRVGGKVLNRALKNGGETEVGAEFVGPTQDRSLAMISELGLSTFDVYNTGNSVLWRNNTRLPYDPLDPNTGGAPPIDFDALMQMAAGQAQLDAWAAELDTAAPWTHPMAKEWDSVTLADWMKTNANLADTKFMFDTFAKSIWAAEAREMSLFYVITYIAAAGNEQNKGTVGRLISTANGAQEKRVEGGTGLIPQRLAEKVGKKNIVFNAAVSAVTKRRDGTYEVQSRAGKVKAKKVVLALGPTLQQRIYFSPPLPQARRELNQRMKMASIGKAIAVYDKPFWRENGGNGKDEKLNGQVMSDKGLTKVTFDNSDSSASYGAIMGFILGDDMRAWDSKSESQVREAIVSDYVRYFGPQAKDVKDFVLQRWDLEEWSRGGPVAVAPPRVISQYGSALRKSVDGLHFAGTETSEYWMGYMDGAIRSGERVAKEILGS
jgi:monoamine oxidase